MKPARSPSAAWQTIDGEMVLLDLKGKELIGLNETGRLVWDLADGTRSIDEIVTAVAAEFDVDGETARRDVVAFLGELSASGLLRPGEP